MNTSENSTASLELKIQQYFYEFGGPVFIVIGVIGCVLSLIVFGRKNFRKNTCSIYYIAFNLTSLFYIFLSLLSFTLEIGYNITPALKSLFYCRFRLYSAFLLSTLCPHFLLFASIDRVLITSRNVRTRQKSTQRFAYTIIILTTCAYALGLIHEIFFTEIISITSNYFYCYIQSGWYSIAISYISVLKEIAIPLALAITGYLSWKNIQTIHRLTINSVASNGIVRTSTHSSKDRQLVLMLIMDIIVYIAFNLIMPIELLYDQITQYQQRSFKQIQIVLLLRNLAIFSVHIPFCISCYIHMIVSKTFRTEVKNIFILK